MEPERLPLLKVVDTPFLSLDGTGVEMASLLFLFLAVLVATTASKERRQRLRRVVQAASALIFFYVVYSCLGVFGMLRNALHGTTLLGTVYSESFFWMALPVVAASVTVIAGPLFCGWICPYVPVIAASNASRSLLARMGLRTRDVPLPPADAPPPGSVTQEDELADDLLPPEGDAALPAALQANDDASPAVEVQSDDSDEADDEAPLVASVK